LLSRLAGIGFAALGGFFERLGGGFDEARGHGPRLGEHFRIFHLHLIDEIGAVAPEPFGDMHRVAVEVAAFAEPGVVGEIGDVDHQLFAFPVRDGIAVCRGVCVGQMLAAVGGDDAPGIAGNIFVEKRSSRWGAG